MKRKYHLDEYELKTVEDIRNQRREELKQVQSVDDILATEAQQEQPPEPLTVAIKPFCPVTYGLDNRPFGDTPPRDIPRPALVAYAMDIIHREGPQSTNALLDRAFPGISSDDRSALRQRLPKWLMAEYREADPPLTMRRYRAKEGNEKRENLFGFWPEPRQDKSRQVVDGAEVLAAIAELRSEVASVQATINVLSQWLNGLKDGVAYLHEKLTWSE
jgi:hypothetical protein